MKIQAIPTLFFAALTTGCAFAGTDTATWVEGGSSVHATEITSAEGKTKNMVSDDTPVAIKLATGQLATLIGGVYVKADDTSVVITWAQENGFSAQEDTVILGAVTLQTTPEESITVANQIAQLAGVSTAAPRYVTERVLK